MHLIRLFIVALTVRLVAVYLAPPPESGDALEYFENSRDLTLISNPHGFASVWQHNPGYLLFCHWLHGVLPIAQAVLGSLTVILIHRLYRAGWIVAFWLPLVAYTGLWVKFTVAGFVFTSGWYLWKRGRRILAGVVFLALLAGFYSAAPSNIARGDDPIWWRLTGFWAPQILDPRLLFYPFAGAWVVGLLYLIRSVPIRSVEAALVLGLSLAACAFFGVSQQRLVFDPVLLGVCWSLYLDRSAGESPLP